jgi:hypothetical protein
MTSVLPRATVDRLMLKRPEGAPVPVGVVIRVEKRDQLELAGRVADELLAFARGRLAKITQPQALAARDDLLAAAAPRLQDALVVYFDGLLGRLGIRKADNFPLDPDTIDWPAEVRFLDEILSPVYVDLGEAAYGAVASELVVDLSFSLEGPAAAPIREFIGNEVTAITDTTRAILRDRVIVAVERGYSIEQLVAGVDDLAGLRDLFGSRARTIALTETANAYNAATLTGYRETGLVDRVTVFDGPDCGWTSHDDPDLAAGSTRTLEQALARLVSHPHCQRAFGAVVS